MCTLTWRTGGGGYDILFNRDELRTRPPASGPQRLVADGVCGRPGRPFLAPVDPAGGGTWIAVNNTGLTLCLLNGYLDSNHADLSFRSRGLLVAGLAGCAGQEEVGSCLPVLVEAAAYRSFVLVAFARETAPRAWRGGSAGGLEEVAVDTPMSSSSVDPEGAAALRSRLLAALPDPPGSDALLTLHRSHEGPRSITPCMHRDDARTVSLTRVRVNALQASMEYAPGPPCRTPLGESLNLDLDS